MNCFPEICVCYSENILPKYSAKYVNINQSVRVKKKIGIAKTQYIMEIN